MRDPSETIHLGRVRIDIRQRLVSDGRTVWNEYEICIQRLDDATDDNRPQAVYFDEEDLPDLLVAVCRAYQAVPRDSATVQALLRHKIPSFLRTEVGTVRPAHPSSSGDPC